MLSKISSQSDDGEVAFEWVVLEPEANPNDGRCEIRATALSNCQCRRVRQKNGSLWMPMTLR